MQYADQSNNTVHAMCGLLMTNSIIAHFDLVAHTVFTKLVNESSMQAMRQLTECSILSF